MGTHARLWQRLWGRLFRLRRDETLPIILGQRRIYILPTGAGYLFAMVLVLMLTGAINYGLSLGHALVFLLAGLGLSAMVSTFRNLLGVSIMPGRAEPVFAGEMARFPMHLSNPRTDSRPSLDLNFTGGEAVQVHLPAGENRCVDVPCAATARGYLVPGRLTLATRYPLGLFRAWSYPYPALSCLVYPKPLLTPLPAPLPSDIAGEQQGEKGQEDFAGLRLHVPGDPPRHIAWKAVARSPEAWPLLTKHFSGGVGEELWLDWELAGESVQTSMKEAEWKTAGVETENAANVANTEIRLSILTGWVLAAERAHLAYGLALPGVSIPPAAGPEHSRRCLETLALFGINIR